MKANYEERLNKAINVTTAGTNLNDYKEDGEYYFPYNLEKTNMPSGVGNGWLKVMTGTDSSMNKFVKQVFFRHGTANSNDFETYVRTSTDGSTWSNWSKYLTEQSASSFNITANTGTLATNCSYKIGNVVGINAKITGVSASAGNGVVLCTLPSGYYNKSTEVSLIVAINNGTLGICWIRTNGQVVLSTNANLSNAEVRLVGSFIV